MKSYFYPKSIYTAVMAFSELFENMTVRVYQKNTDEIVGIKPVPLTLSPKEKIAHILKSGSGVNDVDPQFDNYLPRISVYMTGMNRDENRMRGREETRLLNIEYEENGSSKTCQVDIQPVPYNFTFDVTIWAKYMIDGTQILENILPWFNPEAHLSVKERNFGIERKSKVTLDGQSQNHVYEYGEAERRVLQWTLTFTMESVLWKPMELKKDIQCAVIKIANVPCQKSYQSFQGEKIVIYSPIESQAVSDFEKKMKLGLAALDPEEQYDLMVKHWKNANNTMDVPNNVTCVDNNCSTNPGPKPEWDSEFISGGCAIPLKKPCVIVDVETDEITNYWQEQIIDIDNKINIRSYQRVYSGNGETISGPTVIPNEDFPDCFAEPVVTPEPSSAPSPEPEPEPEPTPEPPPPEDCGYETTG